MPGLWKAWKAKSRLPTLSTSPLGISPTAGEIPTFPQRRRRRRWKSGKPKAGFPLSHRPEDILGKPTKSQGGRASPCARQTLSTTTKGDLSRQPGRRHFQAHAALESNCRFRLMAYWNQFSISGSFVDWNMLRYPEPQTGNRQRISGKLRRKFMSGPSLTCATATPSRLPAETARIPPAASD